MQIDRRVFLRSSGLALLAVACSKKATQGTPGADTIASLSKGKPSTLQVITVQPSLARPNDRFVVALLASDKSSSFQGGSGRVWVATSQTAPALGPFDLTFRGEGLGERGVYTSRIGFPTEGTWIVLVEATPEGQSRPLYGGASFQVGRQAPQPIPGEQAISVATPTPQDHRGVEPYCTRTPAPCSMHSLSLDTALRNGKPTVLIIGTPRFCESRICGPVVDVVQSVSKGPLGAKANFIHVEEYKDDRDAPAKKILAPGAAAWKLEFEPVVYYIRPDGSIVDWAIGPTSTDEVAGLTTSLGA
jgi:hypothetical protein